MEFDPRDPDVACDLLYQAATVLRDDPRRTGSVIDLGDRGRLVMTGDIHDHRPNFTRALAYAKLDESNENHVIVHELIHGKNLINHKDLSIRLQLEACQQIIEHPGQVLTFLANHDLAQYRRSGILKAGGTSIVEAFTDGLDYLYGEEADIVNKAYGAFVEAMPLAVRCQNGVMCAHSLPAPNKLDGFDLDVLERPLQDADYDRDGTAHRMVWGRNQDVKVTSTLRKAWGVNSFICGHQPSEYGWHPIADCILILDSQHNHATVVALDLSRQYGFSDLEDQVEPLAGVG